MKISAPSGSEETVIVPTPSGADDEEILEDSEDSALSLVTGWPAVWADDGLAGAESFSVSGTALG